MRTKNMAPVMEQEDSIIEIRDASVRFNLAMQKQMGLKEYLSSLTHRQLFFQEFFALQHIDLTIRSGESWGFVGKNGSGKSTLLKLITGILKPYTGTVKVNGHIAPLLELGAGFDMELTGRENIVMNGLILGMTKAEITEHFDEIVSFSELDAFLDVPIKNYSSGMKSRLGFSIATCTKPDILIADEVLSTGDKHFREKCEKRMADLLAKGTTLLYVSHSPGAITELCNHAMWLDHGQIVQTGSAKEIVHAYESAAVK